MKNAEKRKPRFSLFQLKKPGRDFFGKLVAMEKSRAHIFVSGMVQGVFFRATTVGEANRIGGLTGWARNLRDGRVEIVCEGDRDKVERLINWLWKGPEYAKVTDVEVSWEKATGEFPDFNVRS